MADPGPHPPLLLAQLPAALARFLDAHGDLRLLAADRGPNPGDVVRWATPAFKAEPVARADAVSMIVLFPTYARRLPGGRRWRATVAGMVSRPLPERSRRRVLAVAVLKRLLDLDAGDLNTDVFRRRAEAFLFQRLAGRRVEIEVAGQTVAASRSDRTGHFQAHIDLDDELVAAAADTLACVARLRPAVDDPPEVTGGHQAQGVIHMVEPAGLSVISDIDDTVKITNVADRRELLRNTLLREFAAVPGMAHVYRHWQDTGTAFHYVSASPWQLSPCLAQFITAAGLPAGSMHLKLFRLQDSTPLGRLPSRKRSKRRVIEQIMADFPGRRFQLVGDSGERDPEVYADVARRRPDQVSGIAIRRVASKIRQRKRGERFEQVARRLPAGLLHVFNEPAELAAVAPVLARNAP
jgi:phosphatidate phosphatase APP1